MAIPIVPLSGEVKIFFSSFKFGALPEWIYMLTFFGLVYLDLYFNC